MAICCISAPLGGGTPGAETLGVGDADRVEFNRDIRPILFSRCVSCHGPDAKAREAKLRLDTFDGVRDEREGRGPALIPGRPQESELIRRVSSRDLQHRMPPPEMGEALSDREIALLTRWIESGSSYQTHWAWIPPQEQLPRRDERHAIDTLIEKRATRVGLPLSPRADSSALIRRLSLDLTGLPPTLEEVDRFLADTAPGAWERLVDRTLSSPHFGERWASVWLDLARYADTRGYEADRARSVWPWRDQLIRSLDADQPFDRFTVEQLAGDLLPTPSEDQILATAFHRNTMTNDEGGTDDEEFRTAAVLDRVDTTMLVWMGLTAGCAQCHDHKYDPISTREYYSLAAFFNQTEDADRNDEAPTLLVQSAEDRAQLSEKRQRRDRVQEERSRILADFAQSYRDPVHALDREVAAPVDDSPSDSDPQLVAVVADGQTPVGADLRVDNRPQGWPWGSPSQLDGAPGSSVLRSEAQKDQMSQMFFERMYFSLPVAEKDRWITWVWLDPQDPPDTVMLQVHTANEGWGHRAVWGADRIELGRSDTAERKLIGALPDLGRWVRLEVPVAEIGIDRSDRITGLALTQRGGRIEWGGLWHETTAIPDPLPLRSLQSFVNAMEADRHAPLPAEIRQLVQKITSDSQELDSSETARLSDHFFSVVHPEARVLVAELSEQIGQLDREIAALEAKGARVPVMRELAQGQRRPTHTLRLGNFLDRGDVVTPSVPAVFPEYGSSLPRNRLGLAQWLVSPANPLTARVQVNRVWEQLFGRGLVETLEDFGTQGQLPSHPRLLDHLALKFIEGDWRWKPLLRYIVTSDVYQRSAKSTSLQRELDPRNEFLSWSPRTRLSAEVVRDQALVIGGLLSRKKFGPPVFPPQPDGVWQVVYNGAAWKESEGEDRFRRAIYTFWRRTSPYPSALTLDAVSREVCHPRRIRSSTPLQSLVAMNDPVYVEAAGGLAARMLVASQSGGLIEGIKSGFRSATCRWPRTEEFRVLEQLFEKELEAFSRDPRRATELLKFARSSIVEDASPAEQAAWITTAQVILQLDEVWTRP